MCHRDESGFTMLEILASVAILSIVVLPLLSLLTSAPMLHARRERRTRAAFLAQLRLEEVKHKITTNFFLDENGEGGYNKGTGSATDFPSSDFPASDANFRYTITDVPSDTNSDGLADIKEITVKVWYDEGQSSGTGEQAVTLRTKVARRKQYT